MRKVLIIGATSAIAQATARLFAADGDKLVLVARNEERLAHVADDLVVRGAAKVAIQTLDVVNFDRYQEVIDNAIDQIGSLDTVLIAHGTLSDQKVCELDVSQLRHEMEINFFSVISLLTLLGNLFAEQGGGTLAVITSVAGDRGRQSNYVYGTAKAAIIVFLQGLRNRLHGSGVRVITIKPGFVDTPMTQQFKKGPLWATPTAVATGIHKAIVRGRDVVYLPSFWRAVMFLIRSSPESLFKRLRL